MLIIIFNFAYQNSRFLQYVKDPDPCLAGREINKLKQKFSIKACRAFSGGLLLKSPNASLCVYIYIYIYIYIYMYQIKKWKI